MTVGTSVDTGEVLVCTLAAQEGTIRVGSRGIVFAANTIEDVFAIFGSVSTSGVASLQAELVSAHEAGWTGGWLALGSGGERGGHDNALVPLNDLDKVVGGEGLGEDKTTQRVTALIGTMGIHLTSGVIGGEVDVLLLDETGNLDIGRGLNELNTGQSTLGDDTGAVVWLGAPGDGLIKRRGGK